MVSFEIHGVGSEDPVQFLMDNTSAGFLSSIVYDKEDGSTPITRLIEPRCLLYCGEERLVWALQLEPEIGMRTFRVDRIVKVSRSDKNIPADQLHRNQFTTGETMSFNTFRSKSTSSRPSPSSLGEMTIVLTGTFESYKRNELKEKLESLGAKVTGSVSGSTDLLIVGENPGTKLDRARERGIAIWDEKRLLNELDG